MILFTHLLFCTEFLLQMHRIMESIANNERHFIAFFLMKMPSWIYNVFSNFLLWYRYLDIWWKWLLNREKRKKKMRQFQLKYSVAKVSTPVHLVYFFELRWLCYCVKFSLLLIKWIIVIIHETGNLRHHHLLKFLFV